MNKYFGKKDQLFIGIVVLMHIAFFLMAWTFKRIYNGDSFEYIYEALNIKRFFFFYSGNPAMPIEPEYMTQRQPLYPLFLLGVYVFTLNNWIVLALQNLLSVFNIYYCRKVLTRIGYEEKYDWLLLLLVAAYPAQFINANTIAPDVLLQTFTLLYFGSFVALLQSRRLRQAVFMSLALIGGMLVKPVLYPFVLPHILILVATAIHHKALPQRTLAVAIMPLIAVLLYNYWNYTRTGKFHFSSNRAFNAVYYFYPYYDARSPAEAEGMLTYVRKNLAAIPEYKDRYDYANNMGNEMFIENFPQYMFFHLKHSARMLIEPGKAEIDLFTGKLTYGKLYSKQQTGFFATWKTKGMAGMSEYARSNPSLVLVAIIFLFNCVRLIGFLLFFRNRNIHWLIKAFTAILVAYFIIAAGPIGNTRYFLPVSLITMACAVLGFHRHKMAL